MSGIEEGEGEMAQTPGLPPGWEFAFDEERTIYYYSHDLGISQYEHPGKSEVYLLYWYKSTNPDTQYEHPGKSQVC